MGYIRLRRPLLRRFVCDRIGARHGDEAMMKALAFAVALSMSAFSAVPSHSADLLAGMSRYENMHERANRKQLKRILGVDPVTVRWCGAMLTVVVRNAGKKPPVGSFRAVAWKNYGRAVPKTRAYVGRAIAVVRGGTHVGVFSGVDRYGRTCVKAGNTSNRVKSACYGGKSWVRM